MAYISKLMETVNKDYYAISFILGQLAIVCGAGVYCTNIRFSIL